MQEILWWCTELRIHDVARVTAVAQIQSLAAGTTIKKKKESDVRFSYRKH